MSNTTTDPYLTGAQLLSNGSVQLTFSDGNTATVAANGTITSVTGLYGLELDIVNALVTLVEALNLPYSTTTVENIVADSSSQTTIQASGDEILFGNRSADTMINGVGNEVMFGGLGNDTMVYMVSNQTSSSLDFYNGGTGTNTLEINLTGTALPAAPAGFSGFWGWAAYEELINTLFTTDKGDVDFRTLSTGKLGLVVNGFQDITFVGGSEPSPVIGHVNFTETISGSSFTYTFTAPTITDADTAATLSLTLSGVPSGDIVTGYTSVSGGVYTLTAGHIITITGSHALSTALTFAATATDFGLSATTSEPITPLAITSIAESPSSGDLNAGKIVTFTLAFNEAVTVTGTPTLSLNDGGTANYTSGSGSESLIFSYTVAAGQNTSALAATAVNVSAGTITDAAGNTDNLPLTGLTQTGPQIDTVIPSISSITENPSSGDLTAGSTVTFTLDTSEVVTVAGGTPTLTLNDGATASYTGGSGTDMLTFSYTTGSDQSTQGADLAATAVSLNGATIHDGAGNAANLSITGLTQTGPVVDTNLPLAPAVNLTSPAPGSTVYTGESISLGLSASLPNGADPSETLSIQVSVPAGDTLSAGTLDPSSNSSTSVYDLTTSQLSGLMLTLAPEDNGSNTGAITINASATGELNNQTATNSATPVTINVAPAITIGSLPVQQVNEDSSAQPINVLSADSDAIQNSTLTLVSGSLSASDGTVSISNGEIQYDPNPGFSGNDTINYEVTDGSNIASGQVSVQVNSVALAPAVNFTPSTTTVYTGESIPVDLSISLPNDTDPSETISSIQVTIPAGDTLSAGTLDSSASTPTSSVYDLTASQLSGLMLNLAPENSIGSNTPTTATISATAIGTLNGQTAQGSGSEQIPLAADINIASITAPSLFPGQSENIPVIGSGLDYANSGNSLSFYGYEDSLSGSHLDSDIISGTLDYTAPTTVSSLETATITYELEDNSLGNIAQGSFTVNVLPLPTISGVDQNDSAAVGGSLSLDWTLINYNLVAGESGTVVVSEVPTGDTLFDGSGSLANLATLAQDGTDTYTLPANDLAGLQLNLANEGPFNDFGIATTAPSTFILTVTPEATLGNQTVMGTSVSDAITVTYPAPTVINNPTFTVSGGTSLQQFISQLATEPYYSLPGVTFTSLEIIGPQSEQSENGTVYEDAILLNTTDSNTISEYLTSSQSSDLNQIFTINASAFTWLNPTLGIAGFQDSNEDSILNPDDIVMLVDYTITDPYTVTGGSQNESFSGQFTVNVTPSSALSFLSSTTEVPFPNAGTFASTTFSPVILFGPGALQPPPIIGDNFTITGITSITIDTVSNGVVVADFPVQSSYISEYNAEFGTTLSANPSDYAYVSLNGQGIDVSGYQVEDLFPGGLNYDAQLTIDYTYTDANNLPGGTGTLTVNFLEPNILTTATQLVLGEEPTAAADLVIPGPVNVGDISLTATGDGLTLPVTTDDSSGQATTVIYSSSTVSFENSTVTYGPDSPEIPGTISLQSPSSIQFVLEFFTGNTELFSLFLPVLVYITPAAVQAATPYANLQYVTVSYLNMPSVSGFEEVDGNNLVFYNGNYYEPFYSDSLAQSQIGYLQVLPNYSIISNSNFVEDLASLPTSLLSSYTVPQNDLAPALILPETTNHLPIYTDIDILVNSTEISNVSVEQVSINGQSLVNGDPIFLGLSDFKVYEDASGNQFYPLFEFTSGITILGTDYYQIAGYVLVPPNAGNGINGANGAFSTVTVDGESQIEANPPVISTGGVDITSFFNVNNVSGPYIGGDTGNAGNGGFGGNGSIEGSVTADGSAGGTGNSITYTIDDSTGTVRETIIGGVAGNGGLGNVGGNSTTTTSGSTAQGGSGGAGGDINYIIDGSNYGDNISFGGAGWSEPNFGIFNGQVTYTINGGTDDVLNVTSLPALLPFATGPNDTTNADWSLTQVVLNAGEDNALNVAVLPQWTPAYGSLSLNGTAGDDEVLNLLNASTIQTDENGTFANNNITYDSSGDIIYNLTSTNLQNNNITIKNIDNIQLQSNVNLTIDLATAAANQGPNGAGASFLNALQPADTLEIHGNSSDYVTLQGSGWIDRGEISVNSPASDGGSNNFINAELYFNGTTNVAIDSAIVTADHVTFTG